MAGDDDEAGGGSLSWHVRALVVAAGAGALLAATGRAGWLPSGEAFAYFGAFLVAYVVIAGASLLPPSVLSERVDRFLDQWITDRRKGFYGVMALGAFGLMELEDAFGRLGTGVGDIVSATVAERVVGFSVDSMVNVLMAGIWPVHLASECGALPTAVCAGAAWLVFAACAPLFPGATRLQSVPAGARENADSTDRPAEEDSA